MKKLFSFLQTKSLILLIIAYGVSRISFITSLPIFTDESIYIFWAKVIATSHSQWFISLTDGKPPLLIWMIASLLTFFPNDAYLLAGRLPSVFAGMMSVIALWLLAGVLFKSQKAQIIVCVLYIIHPFTFLYDRMALFDSLLSSALLWSTYFALRTAKTLQLRDTLLWGLALGIGFLSKPTAMLFVVLTPIVALIYGTTLYKTSKVISLIRLSIVAVVIGEVINNLQRLSSVYYLAGVKNSQFQLPLSGLLKDPFQLTFGNTRGFMTWIIEYYTVPFFILVIVGFFVLFLARWKTGLILFLLFAVPILGLATIGREIFPRYILFTTPYALLAVTGLFVVLWEGKVKYVSVLLVALSLFCLPLSLFSFRIMTNPASAPLPPTDYRQLVSEHPSGYGLEKVYDFLNNRSMNRPVTVVTQGTFGLYPYAFTLEYWGNPNVAVMSRWPLDTLDQEIYDLQKEREVYVILKEHDSIPSTLPVREVLRVEKPGNRYPIIVTTPKPL